VPCLDGFFISLCKSIPFSSSFFAYVLFFLFEIVKFLDLPKVVLKGDSLLIKTFSGFFKLPEFYNGLFMELCDKFEF